MTTDSISITTADADVLRTFKIGDRVIADPAAFWGRASLGRVFVIESKGPKNFVCRAEDGGKGIRGPAGSLLPAPPAGDGIPIGRPFVEREFFTLGEVVTVKTGLGKLSPGQPYVVFKHDGGEKVNIVKLGGEGSRYWRWPVTDLVKRDVAWLAERLVEMA